MGRVLVTGGAGFIGSNLSLALLRQGEEVIVLDNFFNPDSLARKGVVESAGARVINADVREAISIEGIDRIYHLAAQISVGGSFKNTLADAQINVLGVVNALELARKNDCPITFSSSSVVYGNASVPTPETAPFNPESFYAVSKVAGEHYCNLYSKTYGIPVTIFRLFNVYGPLGRKGVIPDFIRKLDENPEKLSILGDGGQSKDFIHVSDVVSAFMTVKNPDVYNLGSGERTSILDIADLVIRAKGLSNVTIETGHQNWLGDVRITQADNSKLLSTGWKPRVELFEGIKELVRA